LLLIEISVICNRNFLIAQGILNEDRLLNILRLQHGVKLLGGSTTKPVPTADTEKARQCFKQYNLELQALKIPIRNMTHNIIHVPDDVDYFRCGIERQSSWMDETFQGKIRQAVNSGNKPAEQIRNKFTRRFLYSLPSTDKGKIIDSQEMFELEVTKAM